MAKKAKKTQKTIVVSELVNELAEKNKRIAELEALVEFQDRALTIVSDENKRLKAEYLPAPASPNVFIRTAPSTLILDNYICPAGGWHEYPNDYISDFPPPCRKCGYAPLKLEVTCGRSAGTQTFYPSKLIGGDLLAATITSSGGNITSKSVGDIKDLGTCGGACGGGKSRSCVGSGSATMSTEQADYLADKLKNDLNCQIGSLNSPDSPCDGTCHRCKECDEFQRAPDGK